LPPRPCLPSTRLHPVVSGHRTPTTRYLQARPQHFRVANALTVHAPSDRESQHNLDYADPKMAPPHRVSRHSASQPADHPPQYTDRSLRATSDNRPIRCQSDRRRVNRNRCVTTASLDLEAFLHTRSRNSEHVAMDPSSLLPWACPDSSRWILANPPLRLSRGASGSTNLRWSSYNRSG